MPFDSNKVARGLTVGLLLGAIAVGWYGWRVAESGDAMTGEPSPLVPRADDLPPAETPPPEVWSVFQSTSARSDSGGLGQRLRLAGTFFVMGTEPEESARDGQRLAILDDLAANRQHIVHEGQSFEEYEILRIYKDKVILRYDGEEIELTLSFKDGAVTARADDGTTETPRTDEDELALESNRFGKRIGETRWVIQKQALVDYYYELLDEPERIAAIYASLKPDYNPEGDITGYLLDKEGEADFFDAVGLREGDRIRKVNSMNMVSQARAEYFIGEFMQDRLGAVVIDVERDGALEKLIYLIR